MAGRVQTMRVGLATELRRVEVRGAELNGSHVKILLATVRIRCLLGFSESAVGPAGHRYPAFLLTPFICYPASSADLGPFICLAAAPHMIRHMVRPK